MDERLDFSNYLEDTAIIDSNHRLIVQKAQLLTRNCSEDWEKVKSIFEFVRDNHNSKRIDIFLASNILKHFGNLCFHHSILMIALCRIIKIHVRLRIQHVEILDWTPPDEYIKKNISFAHGLAEVYYNKKWFLFETVGNAAKWNTWTGESQKEDFSVQFNRNSDCLFQNYERIKSILLPNIFSDYTEEVKDIRKKLDKY